MSCRSLFVAAMVVACSAGAQTSVPAAPHDLEVVVHGLPETLDVASSLALQVELVNVGTVPWDPQAGFHVSYHWFAADGSVLVWDGERTPLAAPLDPGQRRTLLARLRTPSEAGHFMLQWDVVHEGVRWLSEVDPTPPPLLAVSVAHARDFKLVTLRQPPWGWAGSTLRVPVELCNSGAMAWPAAAEVALAAHWMDAAGTMVEWEGVRTQLPRSLAGGDCVAMEALLELPSAAGVHLVQWDMVEEGVCWFSDRLRDLPPPLVMVVLPGPYLPAASVLWTLGLAVLVAVCWKVSGGGRWVATAELWWLAGALWLVQLAVHQEAAGWPDRVSLVLAAAGLAPLLALLLLIPQRWRPLAVGLVAISATLLVQADLVYLRYFSDLLSVASLAAAQQGARLGESIGALFMGHDLWLWLPLGLGLPLLAALQRLPRRELPRRRLAVVWILAAAAVAGCSAVLLGEGPRASLDQVFRRTEIAQDVGVFNAHLVDLTQRVMVRWRAPVVSEAKMLQFFATSAPTRRAGGRHSGVAAGSNLLMIQVESLQSFVLGLRVAGQEVTPNLNRWRATKALYVDLEDQSAEGRSSDSEILTQLSLLPARDGAAVFLYPGENATGMAAVLAQQGYSTLSAVPFDGSFWNRRTTHRAFGFQRSLFAEDFSPGETIGWGLNDVDFVRQMVPRLGALPRPFCAWMITLSLHHPFAAFPARHKRLDLRQWEGTPLGNYLHTMHFMDRAMGELEAALGELQLDRDTVVALWGDHDAGLEWSPELAELVGVPATPAGWYRSQRVPLLIRTPEALGLRGELAVAAGQVDVGPTLLALFGVDPASYAFVGRNLLGDPGNGPVVGEYLCWSNGEQLFLQGGDSLADGQCRDRETLRLLPVTECAAGYEQALEQQRISEAVLAADAQLRLHELLHSQPAGLQ